MKIVTLTFTLLVNLTLGAQSLSNSYWAVYNPFMQNYTNYKFSSDKMGFAGTSTTYTDAALYFVSGNNFKIVDLPPQVCPNDTGYYVFTNAGDFLDFNVVNDPCSARQNVLNNFTWYKAGTVGLPSFSALADEISVSPNPAGNLVNLYAPAIAAGTTYTIIDPMGKKLLRGKTEGEKTNILLEELPPGVYTLQIHAGKNKCLRIVKE